MRVISGSRLWPKNSYFGAQGLDYFSTLKEFGSVALLAMNILDRRFGLTTNISRLCHHRFLKSQKMTQVKKILNNSKYWSVLSFVSFCQMTLKLEFVPDLTPLRISPNNTDSKAVLKFLLIIETSRSEFECQFSPLFVETPEIHLPTANLTT